MTPPSLDVLLLNLGGIVQQIQQAATQARRARFHGAPDMVSSVTDACSLSEVAGMLDASGAVMSQAVLCLELHQREVDRRVAADGRA